MQMCGTDAQCTKISQLQMALVSRSRSLDLASIKLLDESAKEEVMSVV